MTTSAEPPNSAQPQIKSIFDFTAESLEELAVWLEQRGLTTPIGLLVGASTFSPFTGMIVPCGNTTAPTGWLFTDGSAVSRTTFASLFSAIGTEFGAGDGSTTFNLPDIQGRVVVGLGTNAAVNAVNKNDGQTVANRRPHHRTTKTGSASVTGSNSSLSLAGSNSTIGLAGSNSSLFLAGSNSSIFLSGSGLLGFDPNPSTGSTGAAGGDRDLQGVALGGANSSLSLGGANSSLSLSGGNSTIGVSDTIAVGTGNANDALDAPSYIVLPHVIKT